MKKRAMKLFFIIFSLLVISAFIVLSISCDTDGSQGKQKPPVNPDISRPLVCFGDSLTEGHGAVTAGQANPSKVNSYPSYLQQKTTLPIINAGISGDTAAGGLARLEADVLVHDPQIVIVELGANDFGKALEDDPLNLAAQFPIIKGNLLNIISRLQNGSDRKIFLAKFYTADVARDMLYDTLYDAMPDVPDIFRQAAVNLAISASVSSLDTMYTDIKSSYPDVTIINDIWSGVWGAHMSDPIHPDAEGYAIMANNYYNAIKSYLRDIGF